MKTNTMKKNKKVISVSRTNKDNELNEKIDKAINEAKEGIRNVEEAKRLANKLFFL